MTDKKNILWKIYLVFIGLSVLGLTVAFKIVRIQTSDEYTEIKEKSEGIQVSVRAIPAKRGTIYTSKGKILAIDDPIYDLHWDAKTVDDELFQKEVDSLSLMMAKVVGGKTKAQYKQYFVNAKEQGKRYLWVKKRASKKIFNQIRRFPIFREKPNVGGLIKDKIENRRLQQGLLAARTVGYSKDGRSIGIENWYDDYLKAIEGKREMKKSGKHWIPVNDEYLKRPENGKDVYTAIDINIQDVAENELLKQLESQKAARGVAIVMEVETGYVKAIANLQRRKNGSYGESYNHAVGSRTEPGSTFKLASLLVGLEDGAFDIDDMVDTEDGTHKFYDRTMRDSRVGGYGVVPVKEAFAHSSNVAISKLIFYNYKQNPQKFIDGLKKLGLDKLTGIEINGEREGNIKNAGENGWSGVTLPWMSIGYETELTPIQILTLYNAVANNGKMMKPQLVKEIRKGEKIVKSFSPTTLNPRICSKSTIRKAKECMELVVESGTGKKLKSAQFKIAGKTGTTQIAKNGSYNKDGQVSYSASFAGYFPADKPKYSCIVVISAPNKGIYGAQVSGTVFKKIADKVYNSELEYHQAINDKDGVVSSMPKVKTSQSNSIQNVLSGIGIKADKVDENANWVFAEGQNKSVKLDKRYIGDKTMPNVVGMSLQDALYVLENRGVLVKFVGSGRVRTQSVKAGTSFNKGQVIEIVLK